MSTEANQSERLEQNAPAHSWRELQWPIIDDATSSVLHQMAADGTWGHYHGSHCPALVEAIKAYHNVDYVYPCSSGTSAIELALRSSSVKAGDEVILSAYDYKANFANVVLLQATPVLVDVVTDSLSPNLSQIEEAITDRTKAIIVSHLHGWLVDVKAICEIAKRHGIIVIEDACQVPGATVNGRAAGTVGDIGTLSFGGSKLLTAGRGGCVLTSNATLAQRIRLYDHRGNEAYPLSEMQAAVLKPQLAKLDQMNRQRAHSVGLLCDNWPDASVIQPVLPSSDEQSAFYKVAFRITRSSVDRGQLLSHLQQLGVPISEAFPALHRIHSKRRFRSITECLPKADQLHDGLMTLHHPILLQPEAVLSKLRRLLISAGDES